MSAVGANNASDIGLIVQGTLIFLSACIAVVGYVVQSRLSAKAHARQLRLEREERHKDEVSCVCVVCCVFAPFEAQFFRNLLTHLPAQLPPLPLIEAEGITHAALRRYWANPVVHSGRQQYVDGLWAATFRAHGRTERRAHGVYGVL